MRILGIDPGKSGGLAWVDDSGWARAIPMPATEGDIFNAIADTRREMPNHAFIEHVHSMPKQGVVSSFNFGAGYGGLRMALIAAGIPFTAIAPTTWQREFGLPTLAKAGSPTAKKNAHKARALEMFPVIEITHATAAALLIAEWGRRSLRGGLLKCQN